MEFELNKLYSTGIEEFLKQKSKDELIKMIFDFKGKADSYEHFNNNYNIFRFIQSYIMIYAGIKLNNKKFIFYGMNEYNIAVAYNDNKPDNPYNKNYISPEKLKEHIKSTLNITDEEYDEVNKEINKINEETSKHWKAMSLEKINKKEDEDKSKDFYTYINPILSNK